MERCCTAEDSNMMCMVAWREIHMSRCDSKMCMMARVRMLYRGLWDDVHGSTKEGYGSEDSKVMCILARRKGAVLRTARWCAWLHEGRFHCLDATVRWCPWCFDWIQSNEIIETWHGHPRSEGRVQGSCLSILFLTFKNLWMVARWECCAVEDSDMMCMVARKEVSLPRCDIELRRSTRGSMKEGKLLYWGQGRCRTEDSKMMCMIARRKDAPV